MKRRALPLALALVLCLGLTPVRADSPSDFSDVPSSHWAHGYVTDMTRRGIVNGVGGGRFDPNAKVSAAMLVTLLGRIVFPETTVEPWDTWFGPYVALAVDYGWLEGSGVDMARLDAPITRYDMAVVLSAAAMELGLYGEEDAYLSFTDHASIPSRYRDAVGLVCGMGLINGDGEGSFNGAATMSRAEAAAVLYRLIGQTEDYVDEGYDGWDVTPAPTVAPAPTSAPEQEQTSDQEGYTGKSGKRFTIPEEGLAQVDFDGEDRLCTAEWADGKSADSADTYLRVYLDGKADGTSSQYLSFALKTAANSLKSGSIRFLSDFSDTSGSGEYLWISGVWYSRYSTFGIGTTVNESMFDDAQLVVISRDGEALKFYFYIAVENDGSHLIEGVANVRHGVEAVSLSLRDSGSDSSDGGGSGSSSGGSDTSADLSLCFSCHGTGKCSICHGSDICQSCMGRGGMSVPTYGVSGAVDWVDCTACHGNRHCKYCTGGKCSACGGSGRR